MQYEREKISLIAHGTVTAFQADLFLTAHLIDPESDCICLNVASSGFPQMKSELFVNDCFTYNANDKGIFGIHFLRIEVDSNRLEEWAYLLISKLE